MENNLKLDVEAGAVPERIHIRSKRDDEGDNLILPTIDLTVNPFIDLEEAEPFTSKGKDVSESTETGETEKGETDHASAPDCQSPMDDPPLRERPQVETVDDDEDIAPHLREPERNLTRRISLLTLVQNR